MPKLSSVVYGMLAFIAVVLGIGGVISEMKTTYGVDADDSFVGTYDKLNQTTALAISIQTNLTGQAVESSGFFETVTVGSFKIVRLIFGTFSLTNTIVQDFTSSSSSALGLPPYVPQIIITFFIMMVVFAIIAAVLRSVTI